MKYLNIFIIEDENPLSEMHAEFIKRIVHAVKSGRTWQKD